MPPFLFAPYPTAPPIFNVMAIPSTLNQESLMAAKAKAIETVHADKKYLVNKLQAVISYCKAVAAGCKAYTSNEYASLKTKGVKAFAVEKYKKLKTTASKPEVKVTATSAAGGAVTLGAGGGLMGLTAGAGVGAAVGVIPAALFSIFIPVSRGFYLLMANPLMYGSAVLTSSGCPRVAPWRVSFAT